MRTGAEPLERLPRVLHLLTSLLRDALHLQCRRQSILVEPKK